MAEFVVSFVVERLGDLLIEKATLLHGVKQNVEQIGVELRRMQCFLKDADKRQDEDDSLRNWVSEIREVAYDAEDVIGTFTIKIATPKEAHEDRLGRQDLEENHSILLNPCIKVRIDFISELAGIILQEGRRTWVGSIDKRHQIPAAKQGQHLGMP